MKTAAKRILAAAASAAALTGFYFLPVDSPEKKEGYIAVAPNPPYVEVTDERSDEIPDKSMPSFDVTDGITLISVDSPVSSGKKITLTVRGKPDSEFKISVIYSSGPSTAQGLGPAMSDDSGYVSWTWRVGASTKAGTYIADVYCDGETLEIPFVVIDD